MITRWVPVCEAGSHWQLLFKDQFVGSVHRAGTVFLGMKTEDWQHVVFKDWRLAVKYVEVE